ncbi:hypothetical protein AB3N04_02555 [Alkalihalophilus sp. As8PL]|uniref:Uncharacterized protein n=1 Tax=Alkalihalophilus sp. As8PL TaxID=3237103 RepID=A0AB39BTY1_9BACI
MSISSLIIFIFLIGNTVLLFILLIKQNKQANERLHLIALMQKERKRYNSEKNKELVKEQRTHMLLLALRIREAVDKQTEDIHARVIEDAPLAHGMSNEEMAGCFSTKQALAVENLFILFRHYVDAYWLTDQKQPKNLFRGTKEDPTSELSQLHNASRQLVKKIDQLLIDIQK